MSIFHYFTFPSLSKVNVLLKIMLFFPPLTKNIFQDLYNYFLIEFICDKKIDLIIYHALKICLKNIQALKKSSFNNIYRSSVVVCLKKRQLKCSCDDSEINQYIETIFGVLFKKNFSNKILPTVPRQRVECIGTDAAGSQDAKCTLKTLTMCFLTISAFRLSDTLLPISEFVLNKKFKVCHYSI